MKKLKYFLLFVSCLSIHTHTNQKKLLVLDTSGTSKANYSQFAALAESVGFDYSFANFYEPPQDFTHFDAVFLFLDPYFFQNAGTKRKSPLVTRVIKHIQTYSQKKNGLLAILFPGKLPQTKQTHKALCCFFNQLSLDGQLCTIMQDLAPCIFSTDEQRSSSYRTSLFFPRDQGDKNKNLSTCKISQATELDHYPVTLPVTKNYQHLKTILPLGLYIKPKQRAALVLGSDSSFKGTELEENMFFSPYEWKDRTKLLKTIQTTLLELHTSLITHQKPVPTTQKLTLPSQVLAQKRSISFEQTKHPLFKSKISCAWMEIEPLKDKWKEAVEYIKKSNLNLLWTSFNPEWFLSKQAIKNRKEYEKVTSGITHFTRELAKKYKNKTKPHMFVGFDLTNNYSKAPVHEPVTNVYGTTFSKIPSPLDKKHFWKEEYIDPLKLFIADWKKYADKRVPLAGVFFDFEMYHAQDQAATYTNLMDFSDTAWNAYIQHTNKPNLTSLKTFNQRITFLYKNNMFKDYFRALQEAAKALGTELRELLEKELPGALIGAYLPSLLDCWFYRGLFAGLGTKEKPLILATFNLNYYGHKNWIKEHNLNALHLPVVMLSHVTQKDHPKTTLGSYHDGIWINRFSRLFQPCKKSDWYRLECTTENHSLVIEKLKTYTRGK